MTGKQNANRSKHGYAEIGFVVFMVLQVEAAIIILLTVPANTFWHMTAVVLLINGIVLLGTGIKNMWFSNKLIDSIDELTAAVKSGNEQAKKDREEAKKDRAVMKDLMRQLLPSQ